MQASSIQANPLVCAVGSLLIISLCFYLLSTLMEIGFILHDDVHPFSLFIGLDLVLGNFPYSILPDGLQRNLRTIHSLASGLT